MLSRFSGSGASAGSEGAGGAEDSEEAAPRGWSGRGSHPLLLVGEGTIWDRARSCSIFLSFG